MYKYNKYIILFFIFILGGIFIFFFFQNKNARFDCVITGKEMSLKEIQGMDMYKENTKYFGVRYGVKIKNIGNNLAENLLGEYSLSNDLEKNILNKEIFNIPVKVYPNKDFDFGAIVFFNSNIEKTPINGINILLTWNEGKEKHSQLCKMQE